MDPSVPPPAEPDEARPAGAGPPTAAPEAAGPGGSVAPSDSTAHGDAGEPDGAVVDGDRSEIDPASVRRRRRRRKRSYIVGSVFGVLVALIVASAFVRLPYYRFSPGTLYPTQPLITVEGAPTFRDDGSIDFTTVSSKKVSILELGLAKLDPATEIIDAEKIEGTNTAEELRQINLEAMNDAKQLAEVVALRQLGYDIEVTGTGAVVRNVGADMPAAGVLEINDTIVAIDDQPITTAGQAVDAIGAHQPGDTITMRIEPISPEGVKGEPHDEVVTLGARPDDASQALLGVSMGTRDTQFDLPVAITIDSQDVGGPSAGLALTLGIIDVMTPGSLTGGNRVAVTGTIDLDGNVGIIGGIQQKTFLASRSGIGLFIVPADEAEEAQRYADPNLKIVGVRTIDEALAALADNGGTVDGLEQAAGVNTTPPGSEGP